MPESPVERFRVRALDVDPDDSLSADDGWKDMEVRWLITHESVGSKATVVGRTVLRPGSKHDIHRHAHAEEWEYIVQGHAVKHIGDDRVEARTGDVVFVPAGVFHGLENGSDTEPLVTVWGYSGASSLEEAGYELP